MNYANLEKMPASLKDVENASNIVENKLKNLIELIETVTASALTDLDEKTDNNERAVSAALNDLDDRVDTNESALNDLNNKVTTLENAEITAEDVTYDSSETYTNGTVGYAIQAGITASAASATAAASSASTASGYYSDILTAMGNLGSGEAVAAQVALNQADIAGLKSNIVVDLSTRYSTSYANLSAALTALNSDTATDATAIKKAGVSIKFINSSTNKYEQWNLKASSWSTNTSDWALDVDGSITNGKLKLSHELEKPSSNEYVTQASEIGYREGSVEDKLNRTMDKHSELASLSDNTNTLYITDGEDNIIAKFDSDGIHCAKFLAHNGNEIINLLTEINKAVKFTTQSLTDAQKIQARSNIGAIALEDVPVPDIPISDGFAGGLAIADANGNIIAKADAAGMHCSHFIVHVGNATYDLYPLIQALQAKKSVLYSAQTLTDAEKEQARQNIGVKISDSVSDDIEGALYILDSNQYIIAKFDADGLHINNLVSNTDKVVVCDAAGYIAFRIKANGFVDLNISAESFRKAFDEMLGGGGTSGDFEVDAPEELFRVTNDIYPLREYAPCLFAERMQVDNKNIAFSDGSYSWYVANKPLTTPNTPYVTNTLSKRVYRDMFSSKEISLKLETTRASVFEGKLLNFMPIGDSITDQNNWHTYLRKLLVMDNIDWQIKNSSSTDSIKMQTLGIKRSTSNVNISYRNKTVNLQYNYNEGRSSWAAATYLRHAERYTFDTVTYNGKSVPILHVAWRVLGLYEKYGTEYNWGAEHKELIRTTCNGQYPITTACINGYVWNKYRDKISLGSVDYTDATAQQKEDMITYLTTTMLDNPDNPFFSKEKVLATKDTDNCYAFDWDTYYARYKTHNEAGEELEVKGSKATTAMHVCVPNVVGICLGTNDSVWASSDTLINMQDAYQIATLMQEATNAVVIIFANGVPQSVHIDTYVLAGNDRVVDTYYRAKNKKLQSLCGDFANQTEKRIFYCPCYYIQSYGNYNDRPLYELYTENKIGSVLTVGDIHPDNQATAQWSYQVYSLMAYLIAKNIL